MVRFDQLLDIWNRIGVTGPPGAGKSSFIDEFGVCLLESGKVSKLGILAIGWLKKMREMVNDMADDGCLYVFSSCIPMK